MLPGMSSRAPHHKPSWDAELSRLATRLEAAARYSVSSRRPGPLEAVLTDGYGRVLRLETARRRARRRLDGQLRRVLEDPQAGDGALGTCEEIADLTARIDRLRGLLAAASRRAQAAS